MSERETTFRLGRQHFVARVSGALWWPAERLLAFADLHFEKGSSYARHGMMLPPYDTRATLLEMTAEIDRLDPATIVCLGDSFHDRGAAARMERADLALLEALAFRRDWIWVAGNHDSEISPSLPGRVVAEFESRGVVLRHQAEVAASAAEISGHFHPKVSVRANGKSVVRRCFVEDGRRLVLPAFGAYTGGLDTGDPVFRPLFPRGFRAHALGRRGVYSLPPFRFDV